jgi:hypothetical protein
MMDLTRLPPHLREALRWAGFRVGVAGWRAGEMRNSPKIIGRTTPLQRQTLKN